MEGSKKSGLLQKRRLCSRVEGNSAFLFYLCMQHIFYFESLTCFMIYVGLDDGLFERIKAKFI